MGTRPYAPKYWADYGSMDRKVSLKHDLGWGEVEHLQRTIRQASLWHGFPAEGLALVRAEFKGGDEDQRIDLLYLRDAGALVPCELKIGGVAKDAHGQLIRYLADLHFQHPDMAWVHARHDEFLATIENGASRREHQNTFIEFVQKAGISDRHVRTLPRTGILIDEGFPPQLKKAVRHLNDNYGFSIQMLELRTFTSDDWAPGTWMDMFRIDFVEVR